MAQGEAAENDEWYERPMNPLACPIALSWPWLPPSGFLLILRRKARYFTSYADSEVRAILMT